MSPPATTTLFQLPLATQPGVPSSGAVTIVETLLLMAGIYLAIGVVVALIFQFAWIKKLDAGAEHGSIGFRLIIMPGLIALWPPILLKSLAALRGNYQFPVPERPVSPRSLRAWQGRAFLLLVVIIPIITAVALVWRVPTVDQAPVVEVALTPSPLPDVQDIAEQMPAGLPIDLRLRHEEGGLSQVELEVTKSLNRPAVALYWNPQPMLRNSSKLPPESVFLGVVWGPATLRFDLPEEAATYPQAGSLFFVDLAEGGELLTTANLEGN